MKKAASGLVCHAHVPERGPRGAPFIVDQRAFEEQLPDYLRIGLRLNMKLQREKTTHTLSLDIQNVTNRANVFDRFYDPELGEVRTFYQVGIPGYTGIQGAVLVG